MRATGSRFFATIAVATAVALFSGSVKAGSLLAGVAKVDITNDDAGPVHDRLYAKALVVKSEMTTVVIITVVIITVVIITVVIITVDAVAIGEIGPIKNDYLPNVRARIEKNLKIAPANVLANASHCHGVVCADVDDRSVQAVMRAAETMVPVKVGVGSGRENRIMENRRLKLKNGQVVDIRHAYSLPPDDEVAEVGPIDSEIGVLRLDRTDGKCLAVIYNFACHPIQGVPNGGNTADMTGFASRVCGSAISRWSHFLAS